MPFLHHKWAGRQDRRVTRHCSRGERAVLYHPGIHASTGPIMAQSRGGAIWQTAYEDGLLFLRTKWGDSGWGDESVFGSPDGHLGPRVKTELTEDVVDVNAGCALGDHQLGGNLAISQATGDQHGHLPLTRR
jgi:hypothetical protein